MTQRAHDTIAFDVISALAKGDTAAAVLVALEGYGPEVQGFLLEVLRDTEAAAAVFSDFCADVWRGLARFQCETTPRAWMYAVARRAAAHYRRSDYLHRHRSLSWAGDTLAIRAQRQTRAHLRADTRDAIDRLREQLEPDERALLILRVERGLSWREVAVIMAEGPLANDDALRRQSANLRRRFERMKVRLRKRAIAAGLLEMP